MGLFRRIHWAESGPHWPVLNSGSCTYSAKYYWRLHTFMPATYMWFELKYINEIMTLKCFSSVGNDEAAWHAQEIDVNWESFKNNIDATIGRECAIDLRFNRGESIYTLGTQKCPCTLSLYIYMSLCNIVFMSFSVLLFCLFLEKMFLLYFPLFILYLSRSIACSVAYTQSWSQTCNNIRVSKCNWDVYYYYYYIYIKVNISIKYRIQSIFKIYYQLFFMYTN